PSLPIATPTDAERASNEETTIADSTGLPAEDRLWARLDREPFPDLAAEDISGIILGGSPFTVSEPDETKSAAELRAEKEIFRVLDHVFEQDIPFFGACYGIGTLGTHQGALIDRTYGEPLGAIEV